MLVVDAHVHLWATGTPSPAHRQVPKLLADELLREMNEAGIDAAVIQPPAWDETSNEVAVDAARKHPDRFAVLGWFHLDQPPNRPLVDGWAERPGMLGLALYIHATGKRTLACRWISRLAMARRGASRFAGGPCCGKFLYRWSD